MQIVSLSDDNQVWMINETEPELGCSRSMSIIYWFLNYRYHLFRY